MPLAWMRLSSILFLKKAKYYTQNCCFLTQKSALNNMIFQLVQLQKLNWTIFFRFAKVLQEFLLWSTYPSPEIKIKKEKLDNLTFLVSWLVVYPKQQKLSLYITKNSLSLQFSTATERYLRSVY